MGDSAQKGSAIDMSDSKANARTYNQTQFPRKYAPGKRRFSIYWTWSYPWEANRDVTEMDMARVDEVQLTCVLSGGLPGISPNGPLPNQVVSTSDRDLPGENESGHRWCRGLAESGLVLLRVRHS